MSLNESGRHGYGDRESGTGRGGGRAPAFVFSDARAVRASGRWLDEHFDDVKRAAEATTRSGRLRDIEQYPAVKAGAARRRCHRC